jgi:molybdopterin converting factor small subunit
VSLPRLRLFGPAAEAAGTPHEEIPGTNVEEVIEAARGRFGREFSAIVKTCRIWVNGDCADLHTPVNESDEVALLPPVSGG